MRGKKARALRKLALAYTGGVPVPRQFWDMGNAGGPYTGTVMMNPLCTQAYYRRMKHNLLRAVRIAGELAGKAGDVWRKRLEQR